MPFISKGPNTCCYKAAISDFSNFDFFRNVYFITKILVFTAYFGIFLEFQKPYYMLEGGRVGCYVFQFHVDIFKNGVFRAFQMRKKWLLFGIFLCITTHFCFSFLYVI